MRSISCFNANTGHIFGIFMASVAALSASCTYAG